MKLTGKMTLVALVLLTFGGTRLQAQNTCTSNPCSLNDTVKVTVNTVLRLTLSQAATPLTSPNEAAYDAGFQLDGGPTVSIKANRAWTVKVSSNAATWTAVGAGANGSKASTDLQWATNVGGPYAGVSTAPATFLTGGAGASSSQGAFYKTLWSYGSDTPGDYSLVVVYTLSAP